MAPAKVILFGEHFVVKGQPAIASAVNLYARVYIYPHDKCILESLQLGVKIDLDSPPPGFEQYATIREIVGREAGSSKNFKAVIDSEIPIASGMGSSAATSVALTHALLSYHGIEPALELVNKIAYEAEKVIHRKPSGVDNTVCTYGGVIYYRSGEFKWIHVNWPDNAFLVVVDTGIKRNTGEVVRSVLNLYDKYENVLAHVYTAAGVLVERAVSHLVRGEVEELGELMMINQGLLSALGLSIYETDVIIHSLKKVGALGAKISGAGRGGVVIGLFKASSKSEVFSKVDKLGYKYYVVKPIFEGVRYCRI